MGLLHTLLLASLSCFAAAVLGGIVVVALRALALWRRVRTVRSLLESELLAVSERVSVTEQRLADAGAQSERLMAAQARLQHSLTRAFVLARAATGVLARLGRLRGAYPSK
jgi:hypothetical protein